MKICFIRDVLMNCVKTSLALKLKYFKNNCNSHNLLNASHVMYTCLSYTMTYLVVSLIVEIKAQGPREVVHLAQCHEYKT